MTIRLKSKRNFAGDYTVSSPDVPDKTVNVTQVEYHDGKHWIAAAEFISDVYSDPLPTKRDAMRSAAYIIENWKSYYS